jgi:hypothetical protein
MLISASRRYSHETAILAFIEGSARVGDFFAID